LKLRNTHSIERVVESLAVIPARGGSKGIPRKNLELVAGISLVGRAVRFAEDSGLFDMIHVSTDSLEIADEATRFGHQPEFLRSDDASRDRSSSTDVLLDVQKDFATRNTKVNRFVLLEPTSPMRKKKFVQQAIDLTRDEFDASLTVSPVDVKYHPDKQFSVSQQGQALFFTDRGPKIVARQELLTTYIRNGFCYVVCGDALSTSQSIFGTNLGAVVCDTPYINIDTREDLEKCRAMFEE